MSSNSTVIKLTEPERKALKLSFLSGEMDLSNFPTIKKRIERERRLTDEQINILVEKL